VSGIFGILDSRRNTHVDPLLARMGAKMAHCQWYVVEAHREEASGVGLGRIGIGIFNRERQPLRSEDGNLVVFLSGEFYDTADLRRDLESRGHRFRDGGDLELVLRLYQEKGKRLVHDLAGAFVLAIWDRGRQELVVANDRFGLYPLYYAHYAGKLVLAPEMKGVLCDPDFCKELDLTALAEYMRFQQLLGQKTFFQGLALLPNASVLSYRPRTDQFDITPYWDFSQVPELPERVSYKEACEEAGRLFRRAVNRLASGPLRVGVYLSGGLDSRLVLGLIDRAHFPVASITYGQRNCRDVFYAAEIAKRAGSDHHWFEFENGNWVQECADLYLTLTEGLVPWIHAHGMSTLYKARELMDVNLTGWGVDYVVGGHWGHPLLTQAVDETAFITLFFHRYNQKYTWPGIEEAEERLLYRDSLYPQIEGRAFESFKREVGRFSQHSFARRAEFFDQVNHNLRMTGNALTFMRSHFEIRYPAYDYQLYDFACSIPIHLRMDRRMQRDLLSRETPALARIPRDKDELLPTHNRLLRAVHTLPYRLKSRFNQHCFALFPERLTLYADYETYLRKRLRLWAESILFDRRTLERGIFDPRFIRSVWKRHQSGQELHTIGKIAPIMTYEMMLRLLYDEQLAREDLAHFGSFIDLEVRSPKSGDLERV
jgi:asparagine synthase (glutamine-hydrolysing)